MIKQLEGAVEADTFFQILLVLFLVGYFCYKEYPDFKKRMTFGSVAAAKAENTEQDLEKRVTDLEAQMGRFHNKLDADYSRLQNFEADIGDIKAGMKESLDERELMMHALLGVLRGLQELGANGPTKTSEHDIMDFLNDRAHK